MVLDTNIKTADTPPAAIAKRRARNRVSQKSFRERQALYVKELERQLADASCSESTKLRAVQEECKSLRQALLAARKRILGLTTALTGVSDNIGTALGLDVDESMDQSLPPDGKIREITASNEDSERSAGSSSNSITSQIQIEPQPDEKTMNSSTSENVLQGTTMPPIQQQSEMNMRRTFQNIYEPGDMGFSLDLGLGSPSQGWLTAETGGQPDFNAILAGLDVGRALHTTDYQKSNAYFENQNPTFHRPHQARITADIHIIFPPGNQTFPSTFSGHLAACEYFIKQNKVYKQRDQPGGNEALSKLISNMVNMFVNTAWPDMRTWWAYMQSSASVEKIMRWRLDPGLESYQALSPCHRPTATQLGTVHPSIIDWAFFPSIRDRMIELYSDSWMLDRLICELLGAYVVEADLSNIIIGLGDSVPQRGYFRVWDVVQTILNDDDLCPTAASDIHGLPLWQNGTNDNTSPTNQPTSPFNIDDEEEEEMWTPVTLEDIFQSKKIAKKLFKLLHMDDRELVKLDPEFAMQHPELCDDPSILASGLDCTIKGKRKEVPHPKPLTRETIMNYKMMLWKTVT